MVLKWLDSQLVSERELTEALEGTRPLSTTIRAFTNPSNTSHTIRIPNGREWSILSLTLNGAAGLQHNVVVAIYDEFDREIYFFTTDSIPAGADTTNISPNGDNYFTNVAALSRVFAGVKLPVSRLLSNWRLVITYQFDGSGTLSGIIQEHW